VLAGSVTTALAAALPWTARRELDPSGIDPQARAGHAPGPVGDQARAAILLPLAGLLPLLLLAGVLAGCGSTPTATDASVTPTGATGPATRPPSPEHTAPGTVGDLAARLGQEWPGYATAWGSVVANRGGWDCVQATATWTPTELDPLSVLTPGTVLMCWGPAHPELGGEVPGVTMLVLDNMGTVSIAESGLRFPVLNPNGADLPAGLTCAELLGPVARSIAGARFWAI
jgi:hypothetical protein